MFGFNACCCEANGKVRLDGKGKPIGHQPVSGIPDFETNPIWFLVLVRFIPSKFAPFFSSEIPTVAAPLAPPLKGCAHQPAPPISMASHFKKNGTLFTWSSLRSGTSGTLFGENPAGLCGTVLT